MGAIIERDVRRLHDPAMGSIVGLAKRAVCRLAATWAIRGYREANAGHLAAIVAFNALIALVPTFLLAVALAGLILRDDAAFAATVRAVGGTVPAADARDALEAVLTARRYTGWFGLLSLAVFLWLGANLADALAHCLNRVHRVPNCDYVCTRRKAFAVVLGAAGLFLAAGVAASLPTLPVPAWWPAADFLARVVGYAVAFAVATALFLLIYRVLPNAGQRLGDVWPGALVAAGLFVALGQIFPLYLQLVGGANRYGAAFGLVWLMVTWLGAMAHVLLFGAYVNATYMRGRRARSSPANARLPATPSRRSRPAAPHRRPAD